MNHLIEAAHQDGTVSGMSDFPRREVPSKFAKDEAASETWYAAFDAMQQSLRGLWIDTTPRSREKEPKEAKATTGKKGGKTAKEPVKPIETPPEEEPEEDEARDMLSIYYSRNPAPLSLQDCT